MLHRIKWIDTWKGIAIILVVLGHTIDSTAKYIFWFHMPLFFFISGYLYKKKSNYSDFFKKKFLYLIIPYVSFLIFFTILVYFPSIVSILQKPGSSKLSEIIIFTTSIILKQIYGGANLQAWFGVFWFITCLFFTQQLYNIIYNKFGYNNWFLASIMFLSYCLAIINYRLYQNLVFPLSINIVAMALPFYWMGNMSAKFELINYKMVILGIIFFLSIILVDIFSTQHFPFNMKNTAYGIPFISLLIALAGIFISNHLAVILSRNSFTRSLLSEIGSASMLIMYLHQPIQITMKDYSIFSNQIIRVTCELLIPYIIYRVFINYSITRRFFLGIFSDGH